MRLPGRCLPGRRHCQKRCACLAGATNSPAAAQDLVQRRASSGVRSRRRSTPRAACCAAESPAPLEPPQGGAMGLRSLCWGTLGGPHGFVRGPRAANPPPRVAPPPLTIFLCAQETTEPFQTQAAASWARRAAKGKTGAAAGEMCVKQRALRAAHGAALQATRRARRHHASRAAPLACRPLWRSCTQSIPPIFLLKMPLLNSGGVNKGRPRAVLVWWCVFGVSVGGPSDREREITILYI